MGIEEYQKNHAAAAAGRPATADDGFGASAPPTAAATTRPGATGSANTGALAEVLSPQDEAMRAEEEKRQKEEDDFLKLESIFISELGIDPSQLASFLQK